MGFGDRSQYMLVAVPLAVRMLSWMWQTQWPFFVCWRRMQSLAWLQTSCSESQPNQFFYVLPSKQTSICVAYRKYWPQLICVCILHKATENEQHPRTNTDGFSFFFFFFLRLSSASQNGKTPHVKKNNNKNNQNLLCSRCEVSVFQGRRDTASFFSRFLFFSLNACGLSDTVLQRQNPGHFFTLPQNFYLHYTFPASLCCGRQKCWSWHAGRPHRRQLHSEF